MRRPRRGSEAAVIGAIAVGGMVGAVARHAMALAIPSGNGFPWSTFVTNVSGCALIGVLMVVLLETRPPHPLARPFLGVGVLGGYTTFSTYAVETHALLLDERIVLAATYLAGTLVVALAAVQLGVVTTRAVALPPPPPTSQREGDPR